MIQNYFDADCEECWEPFNDNQLYVDRDILIKELREAGWVVYGNECWCPEHAHLAK